MEADQDDWWLSPPGVAQLYSCNLASDHTLVFKLGAMLGATQQIKRYSIPVLRMDYYEYGLQITLNTSYRFDYLNNDYIAGWAL